MSSGALERWLRGRNPKIPALFLPHLLGQEGGTFAGPDQLEFDGAEVILRALKLSGRNRTAAFDLLAGDALLTYACEAMTEEADPRAGLELLLGRLGGRFR